MTSLYTNSLTAAAAIARKVLEDRFFKAGTILFGATMFTNFFNFLFQVTMGRMLTPSDYGSLNALLSILMITAIPFATIMMVLARQVSRDRLGANLGCVRALWRSSYTRLYGVGVPVFLLFLLAAAPVKDFLHLNSVLPVVLLALLVLLAMSYPVNLAFLQGLQNFVPLAIASGALGPLKYGFCVLLVLLGWGVSGVLTGHLLCYLGLFLISALPIAKALENTPSGSPAPGSIFTRASPEFMANLAFAFMSQFDLVLVKHLFSSQQAGLYAVAAVFGRGVMYLPVSLVLALFPMVAESHALRQNPRPLLWKALLYTLVLSGTGALVCWLFPQYILGFLFGSKYLEAAPLFAFYSVVMLPMALVLVLMNYYIAQGQSRVWRLLALGALLEVLLIFLHHARLEHILGAVFLGGMASLLLCLYPVIRTSVRLTAAPECRPPGKQ